MNPNPNTTQLIEYIKKLSSAAIDVFMALVLDMASVENTAITICPYCGNEYVVRNGKKCGKQRFLWKSCKTPGNFTPMRFSYAS